MREIKFRTVYHAKGEPVCFQYWGFINNGFYGPGTFDCNNPMNSQHDQYTGLKDKNGMDIYEGDIVRTDEKHFARGFTSCWVPYDRGEVKWLRYGFSICQPYIGSNSLKHYTVHDDCGLEVIGNIYENPELLEPEKAEVK